MLQAFIVVFREGFESFLIVGIILAYLRRIGEHRLVPAMYWGIGASLVASAGLGYMLNKGVNESLWEGLFGVATILLCTRSRYTGCGYLCPAGFTQIYLGPSLLACSAADSHWCSA